MKKRTITALDTTENWLLADFYAAQIRLYIFKKFPIQRDETYLFTLLISYSPLLSDGSSRSSPQEAAKKNFSEFY